MLQVRIVQCAPAVMLDYKKRNTNVVVNRVLAGDVSLYTIVGTDPPAVVGATNEISLSQDMLVDGMVSVRSPGRHAGVKTGPHKVKTDKSR